MNCQFMTTRSNGWRDLVAEGRGARLLLILLGVWLMAADSLVTATIMPSVGADLDAYAWFGWATSAYFVAVVVASASAGWLSLRIGLRGAMAAAGTLLAAGCLMSVTGGIAGFIAGRVVQGVASGWIIGLVSVTTAEVFPTRHLARVYSLSTAMWGGATFIGPLIGGVFADAGNWQGVFLLFAGQAVLFALAALRLVPAHTGGTEATSVPARSLALLATGITALAAASIAGDLGTALLLLLSAAGLIAATLIHDRRAAAPMLPRSTTDMKTLLGAAYGTYFMMTAGAAGFSLYAPALLQHTMGLSATSAGYVVAIEAIAWTLAALLVVNADGARARQSIVGGAALAALAVAAMIGLMASDLLWPIIAAAAALGAGFGFSYSLIGQRIIGALGDDERAVGSGAIGAVRNAGGAVGSAVAAIAANATGFGAGVSDANVDALAVAIFGASLPFAFAGVAAALLLARHVGSRGQQLAPA